MDYGVLVRNKRQLSFLKPSLKEFGGARLKGNPKEKRPLSLKSALHLVLKSKRAFGAQSMLAKPHARQIDQTIRKQAATCGVKIYHLVNVGNHLHLVIRIQDRRLYRVFIRSVSGLIARQVLRKQRGPERLQENQKEVRKSSFWVARPFTRLVSWGRDYKNLSKYMQKNRSQTERFGARVSEKLGHVVPGFDIQISSPNTA